MDDEMMTYRVNPAVAYRSVNDEVIIIDPQGDTYLGLNPTGAMVWETLAHGGTADDAVRALVDRFGIDRERSTADVEGLLAELLKHDLLQTAT